MSKVELTTLIEAGAHFGHLTRRWNPKMRPYIFMEKNGIHIIDLKKTQKAIEDAAKVMRELAGEGRRVLFVGTKKQAKGIIAQEASRCESNWVSERWLGGMLTNFATIRRSVKRLQNIDKMERDGTFDKITKKEILFFNRERDKLRKILEGVETMTKIPGAIFVVDIKKESISVQEARRLSIPIFAMVDTNCDPDQVDYVIPANDDAVRTIEIVSKALADAVIEGNAKAKEMRAEESAEAERARKQRDENDSESRAKVRRVKFEGKSFKKDDKPEAKEAQKQAPVKKAADAPAVEAKGE